ncbi:MAG TPA: hypothetical protein DDZ78_04365, partial [Porphyromonadaceae bacterium]|nr:hypothetical protein [Porphyromonadaceae bacterium]
ILLLKALVETILKDHPLLADLEEKNAIYQQVVVKKVYSGLGDDVGTFDLKRDNAYRGFRRLLKGFLRFESSKRKDAQALLEILKDVGDIEGRKYADQNTMMRKLIEKLSQEENLARITRLGLTDEANALKTSQDNFESEAGMQTEQNTQLRQIGSASTLRKELHESLYNVLALVSAMRNQAQWSGLYAQLEQLIKEFKTRKEEDEEDEKPKA